MTDEQSVEEQKAMQAFEASQQRRNRIGTIIAILAVCGFAGLKLYQWHLRSEANKPIVITTPLHVSSDKILVP